MPAPFAENPLWAEGYDSHYRQGRSSGGFLNAAAGGVAGALTELSPASLIDCVEDLYRLHEGSRCDADLTAEWMGEPKNDVEQQAEQDGDHAREQEVASSAVHPGKPMSPTSTTPRRAVPSTATPVCVGSELFLWAGSEQLR